MSSITRKLVLLHLQTASTHSNQCLCGAYTDSMLSLEKQLITNSMIYGFTGQRSPEIKEFATRHNVSRK